MFQDTAKVIAGQIPFDWKQELFKRLDNVTSTALSAGKVAGTVVWEALVRQQVVNFFIQLAYVAVFALVCTFAYRFTKKRYAYCRAADEDADNDAIVCIAGLVTGVTAMLLVGSMLLLASDVGGLLNPEYYAFKDLLGILRGHTP